MQRDETFTEFILEQLDGLGDFESKRMFGGTAVLRNGAAFGKIRHDKFWLKVDDSNREDFERKGMKQYTYGKDHSRKLSFYETPVGVIENRDKLTELAKKSIEVAIKNKK
jgi:DNA transformation protein